MALQGSGQISLNDLNNEFGSQTIQTGYFDLDIPGSANTYAQFIGMSLYYRGAGYVPNSSNNNAVPTSGPIRLSNFYGTSNYAINLSIIQTSPETGSGSSNNGIIIFKLSGTSNNYQVRKHTTSNTEYLQQDVVANTNITLSQLNSNTSYEILIIDKTYNKCFKFSVSIGLNVANTISRNGTIIGASYTMNSTADLNSIPYSNGILISSADYGNCIGYVTGQIDTLANGFNGTYNVSYFYGAGTVLNYGPSYGPTSYCITCNQQDCSDSFAEAIVADGNGGCNQQMVFTGCTDVGMTNWCCD